MNIGIIRGHIVKAIAAAEQAVERKEEKENPTDRDGEQLAALEEFIEALGDAMDELSSAYE